MKKNFEKMFEFKNNLIYSEKKKLQLQEDNIYIFIVSLIFMVVIALFFVVAMLVNNYRIEKLSASIITKIEFPFFNDTEKTFPTDYENSQPKTCYTIVLDSGHSPNFPGGKGLVKEEEINPIITEYLRILLENDVHYKAILTHNYDEDATLDERRIVGETSDTDFFVSIHCNSFSKKYDISGFEIYPQLPESPYWERSYAISKNIVDGFVENGHHPRKSTGIFYRRYPDDDSTISLTELEEKNNTEIEGDTFAVIKSPLYAGVLVEVGYVTDKSDVNNWMDDEGCELVAKIIYQAICKYYKTEPNLKPLE